MVQLPSAVPSIVAGLRLGAVVAVLGVVVCEVVASYEGLGQVLVERTNSLDIAGSFAVVVLMSSMAVLLDASVAALQRRLDWAKAED
jgi:NitT/TauT family transport system permease protein